MTWYWTVWVYSTSSGQTTASANTTTNGQGYCGGPTFGNCDNPTNGVVYPYNSPYAFAPTEGNGWVWNWYDTVTSSLSGGKLPLGIGCAGASQSTFNVNIKGDACNASPIIIDAYGEGFHLTDVADGVTFHVLKEDAPTRMSWTNPQYRNGWLALPHDGQVTSLADLFGNLSPQPPSKTPNGYKALAYFAYRQGCGTYAEPLRTLSATNCPAAWQKLRLWIDANHNAVSEAKELHTLDEIGIREISLEYRESPLIDPYGNQFRYVSGIVDKEGAKANRCYDVFLKTEPRNDSD